MTTTTTTTTTTTNKSLQRNPLTKRQKEIFDYITDRIVNGSLPPTVREIGSEFGIRSPNGVMCHLKALEKKGLITREDHKSRSITLSDNPNTIIAASYETLMTTCKKLVKLVGSNGSAPKNLKNTKAAYDKLTPIIEEIGELVG